MPVKVYSCLVQGIQGRLVEVEADILQGLSAFTIVGLGDTSVQESKERIRSAIKSTKAAYPQQKKIINLAPASLRKQGPSFDLPIAVSLLLASGQIAAGGNPSKASESYSANSTGTSPDSGASTIETATSTASPTENSLFVGELALDGQLRPITGILSIALFARDHGWQKLYIPAENFAEASLVRNLEIIPIHNLQQLIARLNGEEISQDDRISAISSPSFTPSTQSPTAKQSTQLFTKRSTLYAPPSSAQIPDFDLIQGQEIAKRAIQISAAGGHHLLM